MSLIGNTPLVRLENIERRFNAKARIHAKCEFLNQTGSAKDRAALYIIDDAVGSGRLCAGGTIIEPTSGNTGIALAAIGVPRGYRVVIVMPDSMSAERIALIRAYGASVVLTPGALGMKGAIDKAESLLSETPNAIIAGQFDNPANALAHYETTGPEILRDLPSVSILVAGIGTGGTITGTGRRLKEANPGVRVIGVEPAKSPLLNGGAAGPHGIQGIGANFIPSLLDRSVLDGVLDITDEDSFAMARLLASDEGLLCGITSGAALDGAVRLATLDENAGKDIVVVLPDSGSRYMSAGLFG